MEVYNDNADSNPPIAGAWQRAAGAGSEVTEEILQDLTESIHPCTGIIFKNDKYY